MIRSTLRAHYSQQFQLDRSHGIVQCGEARDASSNSGLPPRSRINAEGDRDGGTQGTAAACLQTD